MKKIKELVSFIIENFCSNYTIISEKDNHIKIYIFENHGELYIPKSIYDNSLSDKKDISKNTLKLLEIIMSLINFKNVISIKSTINEINDKIKNIHDPNTIEDIVYNLNLFSNIIGPSFRPFRPDSKRILIDQIHEIDIESKNNEINIYKSIYSVKIEGNEDNNYESKLVQLIERTKFISILKKDSILNKIFIYSRSKRHSFSSLSEMKKRLTKIFSDIFNLRPYFIHNEIFSQQILKILLFNSEFIDDDKIDFFVKNNIQLKSIQYYQDMKIADIKNDLFGDYYRYPVSCDNDIIIINEIKNMVIFENELSLYLLISYVLTSFKHEITNDFSGFKNNLNLIIVNYIVDHLLFSENQNSKQKEDVRRILYNKIIEQKIKIDNFTNEDYYLNKNKRTEAFNLPPNPFREAAERIRINQQNRRMNNERPNIRQGDHRIYGVGVPDLEEFLNT